MRRLTFTVLPGVGSQELHREGTIVDLIEAIPYLLTSRVLPPVTVLNEVLSHGESDAGMSGGCRWTPFVLSADEWREVAALLSERPGEQQMRFVEPPTWVSSLIEWRCWLSEYCYGIPAEKSLEFEQETTRLEGEKLAAERSGNRERSERILCQLTDLSIRHSEFVNDHRQPHRWDRDSEDTS